MSILRETRFGIPRQVTIADRMVTGGAASLGRESWDTWPTYDAAVLGLRGYWYPVAWSAAVGRKPLALTLLGEAVMLLRGRQGPTPAPHNRCPPPARPVSLRRPESPDPWT